MEWDEEVKGDLEKNLRVRASKGDLREVKGGRNRDSFRCILYRKRRLQLVKGG